LRAYSPPPFSTWARLPVSRRAAVLLLLFADRRGDLRVVLTMRATTLRSYSGRIVSFYASTNERPDRKQDKPHSQAEKLTPLMRRHSILRAAKPGRRLVSRKTIPRSRVPSAWNTSVSYPSASPKPHLRCGHALHSYTQTTSREDPRPAWKRA
jgi:hypothetical protein